MDAPFPSPQELIRPWRLATIVASLVAAVELVLLVGAAVFLLAGPLAKVLHRHASSAAAAHANKAATASIPTPSIPKQAPAGKAHLTRAQTGVVVLNGNGVTGAAAAEAARLQSMSYHVVSTGNAKRQDYATTIVLYRPAFRAEGIRLGHDLGIKVVGPLDGIKLGAMKGAKLAIILGA